MQREYDYLIVGSGLYGSVFAHEAHKRGKRCLVIDKRSHSGGNIYSKQVEGINVHWYGAHIFHTNDETIWNYVNKLTPFYPFIHSPVAFYKGKYYSLPFNMNTFRELWNVENAEDAKKIIADQVAAADIGQPANLKEQTIKLVGIDIYEKLVKGYSEKQWGKKAEDLPAFLIKRLPLRFVADNNYYNDKYQGLPEQGYNKLIEALLKDIEIKLDTDFFADTDHWKNIADKIVYTGKTDEYFGYHFGHLDYRSLRFEHKTIEQENYQPAAVINHTDAEVPYTRTIEHKYLGLARSASTIVSWEYPEEYNGKNEPFYPVNDAVNAKRFQSYQSMASNENNIIFGGRLAEFRYYDMHQVIGAALTKVKQKFSS